MHKSSMLYPEIKLSKFQKQSKLEYLYKIHDNLIELKPNQVIYLFTSTKNWIFL